MNKVCERIEEMARTGEISGQVRHYLLYGEYIEPDNPIGEYKPQKD